MLQQAETRTIDSTRRRASLRTAPAGALTRDHLRDAAYDACKQLSREAARKIVDEVLDEIALALATGDTVKLHGFGVFSVREKSARVGRNPRTGVQVMVSARRSVSFRPSPLLLGLVNGEEHPSKEAQ